MVAISVFMLAVIGPLTIVRLSLSTAMLSKDQVTAFYLAQDAIEYIVNLRNTNSKNGNDWLAGISNCIDTGCTIDTTVGDPLSALSTDTEECTPLRYDPTTQRYGCNAAWEESPFERVVTLESTDDPTRELTIVVEIRWRSGSFNRDIVITQSLFNIADAIQYSAVLAVTNANDSGLGCTVSPATQTITSGEDAYITWSTTPQTQSVAVTPSISGSSLATNATNFQISPAPSATTDYTLYAQGAGVPVPCEFEVVVNAPNAPVINSFSASQTTITSGQSITLSWDATGATGCTAASSPSVAQWNGVKGVNGTSASISPAQTTTFSLACSGVGGTANASDVIVSVNASNPVAHWQLNDGSGTVADDSIGSNNGTLVGGTAWTTGRVGGGLSFDGVDDSVNFGASTNLLSNVTSATEMAWVFVPSTQAGADRIIHISTGSNAGSSRLNMYVGSTRLLTVQARAGDAESIQQVTTNAALSTDTWNHVAAVANYVNDTITIYINGVAVGTTGTVAFTANSTSNTSPLAVHLGRQGGSAVDFFEGKIDDVRLYNYGLSASEIAAIYNAVPASDTTAPVISGGSPSGTLAAGTTQTTMSVTTNENATCKWHTTDVAYASMANTFTTTGGTSHSYTLLGLTDNTSYTRYIRCQDSSGNANTESPGYSVSFGVASGNALVSHWLLDETSGTVADDSVSTNNGTVSNGSWQPTGGRVNGALSFNGTNASVNAGSAAALDTMSAGSFTYAAWIYPTSYTPAAQAIISKGTGSGAAQQKRLVLNNGASCEGGAADGCIEFTVDCSTDASAYTSGVTNRAPLNTWTHVAVTYTPGSVPTIYVNGVAASTYGATRSACTSPVNDSAGNLLIGSAVGDNYFNGRIDDARVYTGALSATDIAAIYNAAPALDTTAPVISGGSPSGTLAAGTTQTTMSVTTNENATCKWHTTDVAYASMANTFTTTGGTSHSHTLTGLTDGSSYTRYIRCQDGSGNANGSSYTVSFSVASGGDYTSNLVAYWPMSEGTALTTTDSASGLVLTLSNNTAGSFWVTGKTGFGLNFDGTDDNAGRTDNAILDITGAITMAAWVNPDTLGASGTPRPIVAKRCYVQTLGGYSFLMNGSLLQYRYEKTGSASNFVTVNSAATGITTGGGWYHVAVTHDGTNARFYVNGALVGSAVVASGYPEANGQHIRVGGTNGLSADSATCSNGSDTGPFDGQIDQVRLYDRTLSATDIQALYTAGL